MSDALAVALDVAKEAGELLRSHLHGPLGIREKRERADITTVADGASEALILKRLHAAFPAATILTEESGVHAGSGEERWIVDPLDGTTNFAHGYPFFCVSIAYERAGELIAGVVYAPLMEECFAAQRGSGTYLGDSPVRVSGIDTLAEAMTCTGFHPAHYERNAKYFAAVSNRAQAVRRDGSAALDLAYVACGRFDGFWEFGLNAWDVAAGTLLIREARGRITTVEDESYALGAGSILATNGRLHDELRSVLLAA